MVPLKLSVWVLLRRVSQSRPYLLTTSRKNRNDADKITGAGALTGKCYGVVLIFEKAEMVPLKLSVWVLLRRVSQSRPYLLTTSRKSRNGTAKITGAGALTGKCYGFVLIFEKAEMVPLKLSVWVLLRRVLQSRPYLLTKA